MANWRIESDGYMVRLARCSKKHAQAALDSLLKHSSCPDDLTLRRETWRERRWFKSPTS